MFGCNFCWEPTIVKWNQFFECILQMDEVTLSPPTANLTRSLFIWGEHLSRKFVHSTCIRAGLKCVAHFSVCRQQEYHESKPRNLHTDTEYVLYTEKCEIAAFCVCVCATK